MNDRFNPGKKVSLGQHFVFAIHGYILPGTAHAAGRFTAVEKALRHIEEYFAAHMPGYRCTPLFSEDGSVSLQFTCIETDDAITVCGITPEELKSEAAIERLSQALREEFSIIVK